MNDARTVTEDEFFALLQECEGKLGGQFNETICAYDGEGRLVGRITLPYTADGSKHYDWLDEPLS